MEDQLVDRLEFYKYYYDRENERREVLNNAVSIPMGVLSALIAAIVFLISNYNFTNVFVTWVFVIFSLTSTILVAISIYYLIYSFNKFAKGYDYKEIPLLEELHKYDIELKEYHDKPAQAENEFKDNLISEFIKKGDINTKINDNRSFRLFKAKQFLFYSIIAIAITCIPYGINAFNTPKTNMLQQENNAQLNNRIDSIIDYKLKLLKDE